MREARAWPWVLPLFALTACTSSGSSNSLGNCVVSYAVPCAAGDAGDAGLVGYSCSGGARPDQEQSTIIEGVPEGIVCTDEGALQGDAGEGFCCSPSRAPCVYDPVATCTAPEYGYQCQGGYDRPEAFDPLLFCGEGLVMPGGALVQYCCGAQPPPHGCQQGTSATCPRTLVPWQCTDQSLPNEAELGSNQSRADFNFLVCDIPTVTQGITNFCCFTPTLVPDGGSCFNDTEVAGCAAGSFGFACTGPDTPPQDYPAIMCAEGGVGGTDPEGLTATLYCCQYQSPDE